MHESSPFPNLATRHALPEALAVLLRDYPREGWHAHPNFHEMVEFWLDRHLMFRRVLADLEQDTAALLDGAIDHQRHAARLARLGGMFLTGLHGHHTIEDQHFFPMLEGLDTRIAPGFAMLERDHLEIDAQLHGFADSANLVLQRGEGAQGRDAAGGLSDRLAELHGLLDRHLNDEEDLIVPVILHSGIRIG